MLWSAIRVQLIEIIQQVFDDPPIPYEPSRHSLKAWATYCLRNRGFKVVYAERADFAIETRSREKLYFNTTTTAPELSDRPIGWIVWNDQTQSARVIAPDANPS